MTIQGLIPDRDYIEWIASDAGRRGVTPVLVKLIEVARNRAEAERLYTQFTGVPPPAKPGELNPPNVNVRPLELLAGMNPSAVLGTGIGRALTPTNEGDQAAVGWTPEAGGQPTPEQVELVAITDANRDGVPVNDAYRARALASFTDEGFKPPPVAPSGPTEGYAGGFPLGYRPQGPGRTVENPPWQAGPHRGVNLRVPTFGRGPLYYEYDAGRLFGGKTPEYIAQVQAQMVDAGLMSKEEWDTHRGFWSESDRRIMYSVMAEGNSNGMTWSQVLAAYTSTNTPENRQAAWRAANPFVAEVFRPPDYATLKQAVREQLGAELGRVPKDYELALLADSMRADFNKAHAADVTAARSQYEAQARAVGSGEPQGAGSVAQVDPLSRFKERFLQRYAPELERVETVEETGVNVSNVMNNLAGLNRAVTG